MFNRRKEHEEDLQLHPHQWHIQDSPQQRQRSKSNEIPRVPSHCVFQDVSIPYPLLPTDTASSSLETYPTPGHVASHLLLLECFRKLRLDLVSLSSPHQSASVGSIESQPSTRWLLYMTRAFKRFRLWISKSESILRHSAAFNRYGTGSHLHGAYTENYVPPLDVLFVWYCYQQNSQAYQKLISDNEFHLLAQICFPWHIVPIVIDQDTLEYHLSVPAQKLWQTFVCIPVRIEDCLDVDLDKLEGASTISVDDFLNIAWEQTEFGEQVSSHQWLRSPSVLGTLRRGLQRYENILVCPSTTSGRPVSKLNLDTILCLLLQTHRAYPSTWQTFLLQYGLIDDYPSSAPPSCHSNPASMSSQMDEKRGSVISSIELKLDRQSPCYCWICERVRDEMDSKQRSDVQSQPLASSPPSTDPNLPLHLKLSKDQIKSIKADISLHRTAELLRQRKTSL